MSLGALDGLILHNHVSVDLKEALRIELSRQPLQAFFNGKATPGEGGCLDKPVSGLENPNLSCLDRFQDLRTGDEEAVAILGLQALHQVQGILQLAQVGLLDVVAAHDLPLGHTFLQLLDAYRLKQ